MALGIGIGIGIAPSPRAGTGGGPVAPAVPTLTAPAPGATVYTGIGATVSATSTDGDLTRIDWVLDPGGSETVVATDSTSPYSQTWTIGTTIALLGAHTLVARAIRGPQSQNSTPISITIDEWLLSWVAGSKLLQYIRADLGVTKDGSNRVSAWSDQHSSAKHYAQGTAANQPLYLATGGPNSKPAVQLDDAARRMNAALALPTPGTTPTLIWGIMRQAAAWVNSARFVAPTTNLSHLIYQQGTTPTVRNYNAGNGQVNNGAATGTWYRWKAWFENATTDYLLVGTTNATGISCGNNSSADRNLGNTVGASALCSFAELAYANADWSAQETTDVAAYVTRRYGAGLL
jgi:hypothetical protein